MDYVLDKFSEDGDGFQLVLAYIAARLSDPVFTKTLMQGRAYALIETLRVFHPPNKDSIIESLKAIWHHCKARASLVIDNKEVAMKILQWHCNCQLENPTYDVTQEKFQTGA
jgi:hypothetical protein